MKAQFDKNIQYNDMAKNTISRYCPLNYLLLLLILLDLFIESLAANTWILVPWLMDRPLETTTTTQATANTAAAAAIAAVSPGRQNGKRTDDDIRHRRQVGRAIKFHE